MGRGIPRASSEGTRLGLHDVPSPGIYERDHPPEEPKLLPGQEMGTRHLRNQTSVSVDVEGSPKAFRTSAGSAT